jgi:two-component system response regulator FlrC
MMPNQGVLVIEENHKERAFLSKLLGDWGYHVTTAPDGHSGIKKLESGDFGLIISSFAPPGIDAGQLFKHTDSKSNRPQVLFVAEDASVDRAVEMMKAGALDFVLKPLDSSQLKLLVQKACFINGQDTRLKMKNRIKTRRIITQDKEMLRLLDLAKQVSDSKASVLIQGESGTGKELFARFIHQNSGRRDEPFVAVNCGALPETLLESELFGHEKGAFTGALAKKMGKFELADGGTLLLDEISEMAVHLQAKLLRVLQEQEIDRVGGLRPVSVDVRVIATTNRNIKEALEKNTFREDLYYRLNVIPIKLPPLRDRKGDLPLLIRHFIEKYNEVDGQNVKSLTSDAMNQMCQLPFSGNVRELENIMERAILLSDGETIRVEDLLMEETFYESCQTPSPSRFQPELMTGPLREVEKKIIFHTLDQTNGNRTHAAKILGISVRTLRNKLNEYKGMMEAI